MSTASPYRVRRITGRHPILSHTGALAELSALSADLLPRLREAMSFLGWEGHPVAIRHQQGVSVGIPCPPDLTDGATDVLTWAIEDGSMEGLRELAREVKNDQNLRLRALLTSFPDRAFVGEDLVTVGLGKYAQSWPLSGPLPSLQAVGTPGRVPVVMLTGTNGKTTTTRLLAHLIRQAGKMPGWSSSGGVVIGEEMVERGDWTGPGAARRVLRDTRIDVAILETARGGILRRGLAIDGPDIAVLTNVTQDHLGEWGVDNLETMARVKLVLAEALRPNGILIVPADSQPIWKVLPELLAHRPDIQVQTFSSVRQASAWADQHYLYVGGGRLSVQALPMTFQGTARHNVENALAATLVAIALGLPPAVIQAGLCSFTPSTANNPGRMNTFRLPSGALAVVDVAHTPDGLKRIIETLRQWPQTRRTLLLGQTGDRPDTDLRGLALEAAQAGAHRIILKEMPSKLYDRSLGEISHLFREALLGYGVPGSVIEGPCPDEVSGVRLALRGAERGDVVLLLCHETLVGTLDILNALGAQAV